MQQSTTYDSTAYYRSPLGWIEIQSQGECLVSIKFIDTDMPVSQHEPSAVILYFIEQLIQYFNGVLRHFDVPLLIEGTPFQKDVWTTVQHIPFGKTRTYLDIAHSVGDAKSVRAVGAANGRNQLMLVIPCHRVVGQQQQLVGYAGGLWRKKWLLEHELAVAHGVQTLF